MSAVASITCAPYPIYNTSPVTEPEQVEEGTGETSTGASTASLYPDHPAAVDPRVLARVVEDYLGTPYKRGGRDRYGLDCGNLVTAIYRDYGGVRVPSTTRALYRLPYEVVPDALAAGDLVFFGFGTDAPTHVGIYMGGGRFVHASETGGVVYSALNQAPYREGYLGARRVLADQRTEE